MNAPSSPFGAVGKLIDKRIDQLAHRFALSDIARRAGLSSTMLSMVRHANARLPLEKAVQLAEALELDPGRLFPIAMSEALPEQVIIDMRTYGDFVTSQNERAIIETIRSIVGTDDPAVTSVIATGLHAVFGRASSR